MNWFAAIAVWTLLAVVLTAAWAHSRTQQRVIEDASDIHGYLRWRGTWQSVHDIVCELDIDHDNVETALIYMWKQRRVDVRNHPLSGGGTVQQWTATTIHAKTHA